MKLFVGTALVLAMVTGCALDDPPRPDVADGPPGCDTVGRTCPPAQVAQDGGAGELDLAGAADLADVPAADLSAPAATASLIAELMGRYPSSAASTARGGVFARYEADFAAYDEPQWARCSTATALDDIVACNYYDRAMIYYVWWTRTGDPRYLERANLTAERWRSRYLDANGGFAVPTHQYMLDGVALHYLVTGDPTSLRDIGRVGDSAAWGPNGDPYRSWSNPDVQDDRAYAYTIKALLLAYKLDAPSVGTSAGHPGGNDWAATLRKGLDYILANRSSDGQWRGAKCSTADGAARTTHPFTVGLLHDALIRYYESFEADPRIPAAIQRSAQRLWDRDWQPTTNSFAYVSTDGVLVADGSYVTVADCQPEGGPGPAPDLNQLLVNGFAWTYRKTGDLAWKDRADAIFAGGVAAGAVSGDAKHFNQQYTSSYRYLGIR